MRWAEPLRPDACGGIGLLVQTLNSARAGSDVSCVKIHGLWESAHPDFSNLVIHFTGRSGKRMDEVPPEIVDQDPRQRLLNIVLSRRIRAFPTFSVGHATGPVVCLTECTRGGVLALIEESRYAPYGVAFQKDMVFQRGGGPALYVRGDEWPQTRGWSPPLRDRAIRYWPGANEESENENLPPHLRDPSLWTREREWRVAGKEDPPGFDIEWTDIAFLLVPNRDVYGDIFSIAEEELGEQPPFPWVVVDPVTLQVHDPEGVWQRAS